MSLLTPDALADLREKRGEAATVAAFAVGVVLGWVHWAGLIAGGALVGLVAPSFRRALLYGLYLGGVVFALFAASLFVFGTFGRFAGMGQLTALSLVISLGLPTLAAGVRGLV